MARRCPRRGRAVPRARKWTLPQPAARGHWPRTGPGQRRRRSPWRLRTASYSSWLALPFTSSAGCAGARKGPGKTTWRPSRKGRRQRSRVVAAWPPGSYGGAPAVGGDDRAGDVAGPRGGEEGDDLGDLAGLGGAGEQGGGAEGG